MASKVVTNLPTVSAVNKLITGSLPFTNGPYYYPNTGINSVIFPDFSKTNTASTTTPSTTTSAANTSATDVTPVYYPAAELVNVYAAYNAHKPSSLDYEYNSTPDPVANNTPELGINFTEGTGGTGFWNVLLPLYTTMTYGASSATQTAIAKASNSINGDFQGLADSWQETISSYTASGVFGMDGKEVAPIFFGEGDGSVVASKTYSGVKAALDFAITLALKDPKIGLVSSSVQYQDYVGGADIATLKSSIYSAIESGLFSWDDTFTTFYPPSGTAATVCNAVCELEGGGPTNPQLPITSGMYANFAAAVSNGNSIIRDDLKDNAALQKLKLETAVTYLKDLTAYNEGSIASNIASTPKSEYSPVEPGLSGIPAGTLVPNYPELTPPSPSGSSINFTLKTDTVNSQSALGSDGESHSWDTTAGGSYWIFSASASDKGSSSSGNTWGDYDNTATSMTGNFKWSNLHQNTIGYGNKWYLPTALTQTYEQTITYNNPKFKGDTYAFSNPSLAARYLGTSFYNVKSLVYGDPDATITGTTKDSSKYTSTNFSKFQENTSVNGGVGWGPFSMSSDNKWGKNDNSNGSSLESSSKGETFTVTNNPVKGLTDIEGAGTPYGIIGVAVNTVTQAGALVVDSTSSAKTIASTATTTSSSASARSRKRIKTVVSITHSDVKSSKTNQFIFGPEHNIHYGSDKANHIKGGAGDDVLAGLAGNDHLDGGKGDDVIFGGPGRSKVTGGKGSDYVVLEKEHVENGAKVRVLDFNLNDNLSFTSYVPEDISVKRNKLMLNDVFAARFIGMSSEDLTNLIGSAHFSNII